MIEAVNDRIYFRQLLAGRDIARGDNVAQQMVNFVYLIGDRVTGEAVVVDPAYDIPGILEVLQGDDMHLVGAMATHYHPDHVGGTFMGITVSGVAQLLESASVPVHVQSVEADGVLKMTGADQTDLVEHRSGDIVTVGQVPIELIHTPGHTPGSQCFLLDGHLVAGDTLFLEGCGRVDLPGGDPEALYHSINSTLAKVPDETVLFPGHLYAPEPSAPLGEIRRSNYVFRFKTLDQWKIFMGG
ncbi:MAG: MBL fold metallo-hydrolase [Acidimicrobiia bacterium]|nr:MBL fold metallo-hydrolase [Acidimicrobiia bacterium]